MLFFSGTLNSIPFKKARQKHTFIFSHSSFFNKCSSHQTSYYLPSLQLFIPFPCQTQFIFVSNKLIFRSIVFIALYSLLNSYCRPSRFQASNTAATAHEILCISISPANASLMSPQACFIYLSINIFKNQEDITHSYPILFTERSVYFYSFFIFIIYHPYCIQHPTFNSIIT